MSHDDGEVGVNRESEFKHPFAILILSSLRICKFMTKDELQDAILALKKDSKSYVPLVYHAGANTYFVAEVCDTEWRL